MTDPAPAARARALRRAARAGALAGDAGYLLAWLLAPAVAWAPWAIAVGLALAGARILRALQARRGGATPPWTAFCAPLILPLSTALAPPATGAAAPGADRVGLGIALAALLGLSLTGLAGQRVVDPVLAPVDDAAAAYVDRALLQAGGTYVGARALERLLAIAGDISIGIGFIEGRPGQIFEPLRDLLDRFSTVVLAALASLTLQKVLLELGPDVALPLFVAAAAVMATAAVAAGPRRRLADGLGGAAALMLGTAVVLRVLVPLTGVAVAALTEQALAERQRAAATKFEAAAAQVGLDVDLDRAAHTAPPATAAPTLGDRMGTLKEQAQALKSVDQGWLDRLFDALIDLVAVFVIETLIAPLAVLILLWRLWRRLAGAIAP